MRASSITGTVQAMPWLPLPPTDITLSGQPAMRASEPAAVADMMRRVRLLSSMERPVAPAAILLPTCRP